MFSAHLILWAVALSLRTTPPQAEAVSCRLVDLIPEYGQALGRLPPSSDDHRLVVFQRRFIANHEHLYRPDVLGLATASDLKHLLRRSLPNASMNLIRVEATDSALRDQLTKTLVKFRAAFPDFNCDFAIYLMPTFGALDGASRRVNGAQALVLGIDTIVTEPVDLGVLLSHELFHRYHFQASGFSDEKNKHEVLWRGLWSEGLATYISAQLNSDKPLSDVWILPRDLDARTQPHVREIAAELLEKLDTVDEDAFGKYFSYGNKSAEAAGLPWRSGYYVGYLVARRLATSHSLSYLAHLNDSEAHREISAALAQLAAGGGEMGKAR